ncbi:hypothetical protein ACFYVL_29515 [Streptomyces sp. NPDC004111]|uniref:hypothetical protein n=1 Tax=Streptomyces sp. NPDC004111 TaxID=3364690 RepID=UPI0036847F52
MTPKGRTPKKFQAPRLQDPVNRTILLLDIERYSHRDDVEQAFLRRMMYDVADRTLHAAGIEVTRRLRADQGDCVIELIDANASLPALLRALLNETPAQLRATNRTASASAQIRLRAVLATGYVAIDENGWVGADLNFAFRLLDAQQLRDALVRSGDDFALCVSDPVHRGIVRHNHPGIPAEKFHPVVLEGKNGPMEAWLYGSPPAAGESPTPPPDEARRAKEPADEPVAEAVEETAEEVPEEPPAAESPAAPTYQGSDIKGDQTGIAGGTFHAPVNFGGINRDGPR